MSRRELAASPSSHSRTTGALLTRWTVSVGVGLAMAACGGDGAGPDAGGGGSLGSGGTLGTGGSSPSAGGTISSGGSSPGTGGASSGGAASSGGTSSGGTSSGGATLTGGASSGGAVSTGGAEGVGGAMSGGATGAGGGGSDTCEKGTTMGNEVLFIGESFIQASTIPEETTKLARTAGMLGASDSYVDKSISGTWIGDGSSGSIPNQYKNNSSGVRFVIMDGGGNDCWQGGQASDRTNALNAAKKLFDDMDGNGVEKLVYMFYADPIGSQFNSLKSCLDLLRPDMKALCDAQGSPKCYWLDLRETWDGHAEYTSDGIHVAGPGNVPTATAIFETMEENCVAP